MALPIEVIIGENTDDLFLESGEGWERISKTSVIIKIEEKEE